MFVTSVKNLQNIDDVFVTSVKELKNIGDVFVTSTANLQNIGDVFVTSVENLQTSSLVGLRILKIIININIIITRTYMRVSLLLLMVI